MRLAKTRTPHTGRSVFGHGGIGVALADGNVDVERRVLPSCCHEPLAHRQAPVCEQGFEPQARVRQVHHPLPVRDQLTDGGGVHLVEQVERAAIDARELAGQAGNHLLQFRHPLRIPCGAGWQQRLQLSGVVFGGSYDDH